MKYLITALIIMSFSAAYASSPVGLWKTIDDKTGEPKALVRISDGGGTVSGKIEKLLNPNAPKNETCAKCDGDRKGKPIVGLTILRNLKKDSSDSDVWSGGDVLDPKNGKVYKARIEMKDGGKKLELRGYLGPFYRTQVWQKAD